MLIGKIGNMDEVGTSPKLHLLIDLPELEPADVDDGGGDGGDGGGGTTEREKKGAISNLTAQLTFTTCPPILP